MIGDKSLQLAKHRINTAKEDWETAVELLKISRYKGAINRAYYAIFHFMRAVLAHDEVDFKRHSGVIAYFRQNFIKTGVFDNSFSEIIQTAGIIRNESDYSDFYIASSDEAKEQVEKAGRFYEEVVKYLESKSEWIK